MAELADAADSKSADFTIVRVRPPLQVPLKKPSNFDVCGLLFFADFKLYGLKKTFS